MEERCTLQPDLLLRIKFFIRDLLSFQSDEGAQRRLADDPTAEFYMSSAYFSPAEAHMPLQAPSPSPSPAATLTLRQALQEVLLRKEQRGDYGVCTSHDLAPIIQRWFNVCKGFEDNPSFRMEFKRSSGPVHTAAHQHEEAFCV